MTPIRLHWRSSPLASAMHAAAEVQFDRTLIDPDMQAALEPIVRDLRASLVSHRIVGRIFFSHLPHLAVEYGNPREMAEIALRKAKGSSAMEYTNLYAEHLRDIVEVFSRFHPANAEELITRSGPLRELWEARGPGLLMEVGRLAEPQLIPENAQVILVQPVLGGAGSPHSWYNSLRIEAVLANPVAELPEVLRLAWLIGQLQLELPRYRDDIGLADSDRVGALALIPLILAAGEYVEWCHSDAPTIEKALAAWLPEVDHATTLEPLLSWWDVYQESKLPFGKALAALGKLLPKG